MEKKLDELITEMERYYIHKSYRWLFAVGV